MASTRVQGNTSGTSSGTAAITYGAAPTLGNLMIAYIAVGNTTLTATNSFTKLTDVIQGTLRRGALFWKVADSGDTGSATVNVATLGAAGNWRVIASEWSNALGWPATPTDGENAQTVAATASYTTQTITPGTTGREGVIAAGYAATNVARTWSAEAFSGSNVGSVTEEADADGATLADAAVSSITGNYSGSATLSTSTSGIDSIAVFMANAPQDTPELWGRPFGLRGAGQMHQLLSQ